LEHCTNQKLLENQHGIVASLVLHLAMHPRPAYHEDHPGGVNLVTSGARISFVQDAADPGTKGRKLLVSDAFASGEVAGNSERRNLQPKASPRGLELRGQL